MLKNLDCLLSPAELTEFSLSLDRHPARAIRLRDDFSEDSLPFQTVPVPWYDKGRLLKSADCRPGAFLEYPAGCYYIQDAGSLLPVGLLDPKPGEIVCDLCAAPGGKSTAILERMNGQGVLIANEPIRSRTNVLKFLLGRTGMPNYLTTELDPAHMAQEFEGVFDAVIVDAPCSGQMMVSRDKRDTNAWSSHQIEHSAARQQRILDAALRLLRPGGRLVYSTCTFAIEENERQLSRLIHQYQPMIQPLRREALKCWESPLQPGCYRLWPHRDPCAGGFAGGIIVSGHIGQEFGEVGAANEMRRDRRDLQKRNRGFKVSRKKATVPEIELDSIGEVMNGQVRVVGKELCFGTAMVWELFDSHSNVAKPPMIMLDAKRRYEPSHTLSLARDSWFRSMGSVSLDDRQAVSFLAGESLRGLEPIGHVEWVRVLWNAKCLGWGRFSQSQLKNHLPPWARVTGLLSR